VQQLVSNPCRGLYDETILLITRWMSFEAASFERGQKVTPSNTKIIEYENHAHSDQCSAQLTSRSASSSLIWIEKLLRMILKSSKASSMSFQTPVL
jgi:hypothetical protein